MAQSGIEPFPPVSPTHHLVRRENPKSQTSSTRPRRKSSGLGGEPRGDTAAPALATLSDRSPPPTPVPSRTTSTTKGRKRRKAKNLFRRWKATSLRHTWLNPLIICLIVISIYLTNPTPLNPVHAALFLSYPLPRNPNDDPSTPIQYGKGGRDFAFVAFYTIFLSFTREFLMQRLLRPLAISCGIRSRAKQSRFMEQFYTALYFAAFGPFGLYVMSRTPVWYFNTAAMYEGFPHRTHEALFKAYYLLQASYWAQQMIVLLLMLEKPRKDFKELVMHHVITLALIWLSYRFHFTYMGLAVYITHDISDFFLATSKTLNYLDSALVGPYFGFFILVWAYLRHYINLRILLSILPLTWPFPSSWHPYYHLANSSSVVDTTTSSSLLTNISTAAASANATNPSHLPSLMLPEIWTSQFATIGPFELDWATQQYKCWISQWITFALLACLQAVNLFWLFLILRIAWRLVASMGEEAKDERSEYEESEREDVGERVGVVEEEEKGEIGKRLEEKVGEAGELPGPMVLVNGEPVGADEQESKGPGKSRERRKGH